MCRSVPQIPVMRTRTLTSLMPISGSGTSSSQRPQLGLLFTRAFILFDLLLLTFCDSCVPQSQRIPDPLLYSATEGRTTRKDQGQRSPAALLFKRLPFVSDSRESLVQTARSGSGPFKWPKIGRAS